MFYENFVKKIESEDFEIKKEKYIYGLNYLKKTIWIINCINFMVLGFYFAYLLKLKGSEIKFFFIPVLLLFFSFAFLMTAFSYKVTVDLKSGDIIFKNKLNLKFEEIEKITLKNMLAPGRKKVQYCLSIITKEKIQMIFPLVMHNRFQFVMLMKKIFENKFFVDK